MQLGAELLGILRDAKEEVFIASPFIKRGALHQVLEAIPVGLPVTIVVRYLAADLAAGVTDSEIVEEVGGRPSAQLLMQPALHAKLYRADGYALVGSANLTGRALGWSTTPNLELLVAVETEHPQLQELERVLRSTAVPLTRELAKIIEESIVDVGEISERQEEGESEGIWVPSCTRPDILWQVRSTGDAKNATVSAVRAAVRDIEALQVPHGLPKDAFNAAVRALFLSSPFYSLLTRELVGTGISDVEARVWLEDQFGEALEVDAQDAWDAVKQWLRQFGEGVRIEADSERTRLAERIGRT